MKNRCQICGALFQTPNSNKKCCSNECSRRMVAVTLSETRKRMKKKQEEEKRFGKEKTEIERLNSEANRLGISYGQYVAMYRK